MMKDVHIQKFSEITYIFLKKGQKLTTQTYRVCFKKSLSMKKINLHPLNKTLFVGSLLVGVAESFSRTVTVMPEEN